MKQFKKHLDKSQSSTKEEYNKDVKNAIKIAFLLSLVLVADFACTQTVATNRNGLFLKTNAQSKNAQNYINATQILETKKVTKKNNKTATIAKQAKSTAKQTAPVAKQATSIAKQTAPIAKQATSIAKQTAPVARQTTSVSKRTAPVKSLTPLYSEQTTIDTDKTEIDTDIIETDVGIIETDADLTETDTDLTQTDTDIIETDTDIIETDTDLTEADTDLTPADTDVTVENTSLEAPDANIQQPSSPTIDEGSLPLFSEKTTSDKSQLPQTNDIPSSTASLITSLLGLIIIALVASWFIQKKSGFTANNFGKTLGIVPLDNKRLIYVVDIMGKVLVLGVTEYNINFLTEITDKDTIDAYRLKYGQSVTPGLDKLFPFLPQTATNEKAVDDTIKKIEAEKRRREIKKSIDAKQQVINKRINNLIIKN